MLTVHKVLPGSFPGKAEPKTLKVSQIICSVISFSSIPDYLQLNGLLQPDNTGEDMR